MLYLTTMFINMHGPIK